MKKCIRLLCVFLVAVMTLSVTACDGGMRNLFETAKLYEVHTSSMEPTFYPGDVISYADVKDSSELQVGDIIVYWTIIDGERVMNAHRIVEISEVSGYLAFTTKGDNNVTNDAQYVHEKDVVGKFVSIISSNRR